MVACPKVHFQAPPREKGPESIQFEVEVCLHPALQEQRPERENHQMFRAWKSKLTLMLQLPQKHAAYRKNAVFFGTLLSTCM